MLHDQQMIRDRIEAAMHDSPFCEACGAPTDVVDHGGVLWLQCSSLAQPRSRIAQALASMVPHERRIVADLRPAALVA